MLVRIIGCLLVGILLLSSCKSKKKVVNKRTKPKTERVVRTSKTDPSAKKRNTKVVKSKKKNESYSEVVSAYIRTYGGIAKEEMLQYGIPASITIAQGILESGAGRGELTSRANNHFGIKCHKSWSGERVYHDDDESQECFRKYKDAKYSFRDHSLFLSERSRYQNLFKLRKDDYKGWAKGLRKAGYATDPKYPSKLISIIEKYDLSRLDSEVLGKKANLAKPDDTKISTHEVKRGDTLYSISRMYNLSVDTLKEFNGLKSNEISIGQILYLHANKK